MSQDPAREISTTVRYHFREDHEIQEVKEVMGHIEQIHRSNPETA